MLLFWHVEREGMFERGKYYGVLLLAQRINTQVVFLCFYPSIPYVLSHEGMKYLVSFDPSFSWGLIQCTLKSVERLSLASMIFGSDPKSLILYGAEQSLWAAGCASLQVKEAQHLAGSNPCTPLKKWSIICSAFSHPQLDQLIKLHFLLWYVA